MSGVAPGQWSKLSPTDHVHGKYPRGRYSHAAAVVGGNVFIVGGNGSGRLLGDVHVLDVSQCPMNWSKAAAPRNTARTRGGGYCCAAAVELCVQRCLDCRR